MRPPRGRASVAAALAGAATLALALRVCYVTEEWRTDDVLDLARALLEVVAVAAAGAVLARHDEGAADAADADADDGVIVNLRDLESDEGASARFERERRAEAEAEADERARIALDEKWKNRRAAVVVVGTKQ
jgi:hypothetical protein